MSKLYAYILAGVVLGAAVYGVAWYLKPPEMPAGITVEAKPAKEVAKEQTEPLFIDFVKVYKPAVKAKLKLPKSVVEDSAQHVVASNKVPASEHPHTITTTLDAKTGEFTTYDRTDQLPWVAVNTRTEIGMYVGVKSGGERVFRLEAKQELLQVKALHVGAVANIDSGQNGVDGFIGVGTWVRF